MKKYFIILWLITWLLISVNTVFATQKIKAYVSILPQKFFVQQIGKDLVDVKVMVLPGASPATYEPKPRQMVNLSKTQLYFSIGVPFENKWLKKIALSNSKMKIIHTDHGISKIRMASDHHHDQGKHHKGHEGFDPHIWLSPALVKIQAKIIVHALKQTDPKNKAIYQNNFESFIRRVEKLDDRLTTLFKNKNKPGFLVFHPSWGYFAKNYQLKQIPIEIEGKNPKPVQIKEIIDYSIKNNINIIFVQPQNSTKSARIIAREINGHIVFADPLAFDWFTNLEAVAQKIQEALK